MTRQHKIKLFGREIVEDDERYWKQLGYRIDYSKNLLVKE